MKYYKESCKKKSLFQFFLLISILLSFYILFLFFRPFKELLYALELPELYKYIKLLLMLGYFFFIFLWLLLFPKLRISKILLFYLLYSMFNLLFLHFFMDYSVSYIAFSFYDTFGILFFALILFFLRFNLSTKMFSLENVIIIIIILYFAIFIFGFLQYVFNQSLMFFDESYYYISEELKKFRVFSFLPSRIQFGKFSALIGIASITYILFSKQRNKFPVFMLFVVSVFGVYISTERASLVLLLVSILNLFALKRNFNAKKIFYLNLMVSFLVFLMLFFIDVHYYFNSTLFRTNSLLDRLYWWSYLLNNYVFNNKLLNIFLGYGIVQVTSEKNIFISTIGSKLWIDNLFLTIFMYQGIIGLSLFISVYYSIFKKVLILTRNSWIKYYFLSTLPAWFIEGVFARSIGDIVIFSLLPAFLYITYSKRVNSIDERNYHSPRS